MSLPASWDAAGFRTAVEETLSVFLDERALALEPLGPDAAFLVAAARNAVSGGKRLRAAFCAWGYRSVREPDDPASLLRAAAALELLHASALVHDDVMDASDTRRGRPAAHRAFEAMHRERRWPGDAEQYGVSGAILVGDLLLSWADGLLRTCGLPPDRVLAALSCFDMTRAEVVAGQFLDVSLQARADSDMEQAMRVLRYKSAKYSVERPLHIGAALAGADDDLLAALSAYGVPVGEAFQLRDDLLGVYGDPQVTGKPAGGDLVEGKRTVLVALAVRRSTDADRDLLQSALGRPLTAIEVEQVRAVLERSGAAAEVEALIRTLTDTALAALARAPVTPTARSVLQDLAGAATQRVR